MTKKEFCDMLEPIPDSVDIRFASKAIDGNEIVLEVTKVIGDYYGKGVVYLKPL